MAASLSVALSIGALVPGPWSSPSLAPSTRARLLAANLTLEEKLDFLHGPPTGPAAQCKTARCAYVGNVAPNARLRIPPLTMNDGPQGFRDNKHPGTSTAWPSGLTMAASWDVAAMEEWGVGMGKEFRAKGSNVQLGPGLCLARVPRNGRNFEYLSGEDPMLGHQLVQPVIRGIQSQGVIANAKHWVLNNQETNRGSVYDMASERVRFELYYPRARARSNATTRSRQLLSVSRLRHTVAWGTLSCAAFAGAIEAKVGSVMCSYNKVAGDKWSCENPETLATDLKQRLKFEGFVMVHKPTSPRCFFLLFSRSHARTREPVQPHTAPHASPSSSPTLHCAPCSSSTAIARLCPVGSPIGGPHTPLRSPPASTSRCLPRST